MDIGVHLLNLLLQLLILQQRFVDRQLPELSLLLIFGDLGLGPTALDAHPEQIGSDALLGADGGGLLKCRRHLWVHLDLVLAVDEDLAVSSLYLSLEPVAEGLADDREGHVADELFRKPPYLDHVREPVSDVRLLHEPLADLLDGAALVLRDGDMLDLLVRDPPLFAADEVLEVVNAHRLIWRQVGVAVDGQEV